MKKRLIANLVLCTFAVFVFGNLRVEAATKQEAQPNRLELPASHSAAPVVIVEHLGYTVSYNKDSHLPEWVAYELTADEVDGTYSRDNNFRKDPKISSSLDPQSYTNTGYDRGHMAPAGDMTWSAQAMSESFYMSNMCPQDPSLNRGSWKKLEEHIRTLASKYDSIYICCGPIIGPNSIYLDQFVVPDEFFKVLLRHNNDHWSAIGFKMPNEKCSSPLEAYALTVDDIEKLTSIDFFCNLSDSIESIVESTYSLSDWDLQMATTTTTSTNKNSSKISSSTVGFSQKSTTTSSSTSTSTYNGHTVYTGPRGGKYYINSKGNKVYIKRK